MTRNRTRIVAPLPTAEASKPKLFDLLSGVGVAVATAALTAAIGWGATTTSVRANTGSIDKLWSSLKELRTGPVNDLQRRMSEAEKVNARIEQHLIDDEKWHDHVDAKLDRIEEKAR